MLGRGRIRLGEMGVGQDGPDQRCRILRSCVEYEDAVPLRGQVDVRPIDEDRGRSGQHVRRDPERGNGQPIRFLHVDDGESGARALCGEEVAETDKDPRALLNECGSVEATQSADGEVGRLLSAGPGCSYAGRARRPASAPRTGRVAFPAGQKNRDRDRPWATPRREDLGLVGTSVQTDRANGCSRARVKAASQWPCAGRQRASHSCTSAGETAAGRLA